MYLKYCWQPKSTNTSNLRQGPLYICFTYYLLPRPEKQCANDKASVHRCDLIRNNGEEGKKPAGNSTFSNSSALPTFLQWNIEYGVHLAANHSTPTPVLKPYYSSDEKIQDMGLYLRVQYPQKAAHRALHSAGGQRLYGGRDVRTLTPLPHGPPWGYLDLY